MTLGSIMKSNLFDYFDVSYGIIYATDIAQVVPVVVACFVLDFLVIGSAVVVVVKNDPDISRQQRLEMFLPKYS